MQKGASEMNKDPKMLKKKKKWRFSKIAYWAKKIARSFLQFHTESSQKCPCSDKICKKTSYATGWTKTQRWLKKKNGVSLKIADCAKKYA